MPSALITGASRGVGRGVAIALSDAGYRVFATGRTIERADLPPGLLRRRCDHTNADEVAALFAYIAEASGGLDVLANSAWGGYERMVDETGKFTWGLPFWQQPPYLWTSMMDAGVRAAYLASTHAARLMVPARRGFIVNISFWPAQKHIANVVYGVSKAATDKMTADMAHELRAHGVSVVSLYPGLVRTEAVLQAAQYGIFDLSNSESPEFIGRVIAALATDPSLPSRSGQFMIAAQEALRLGVVDIDGTQPAPLSLDKV